jgi:hypothetical protein
MHEMVVVGETKPGDLMERPFVAVPYAQWLELTAAAQREAGLTEQLATEKERSAGIVANLGEYMRDHQVLIKQERDREGR